MLSKTGPFFQNRWLHVWLPGDSATLCLNSMSLRSSNGFRSQAERTALVSTRTSGDDTHRRLYRDSQANSSRVDERSLQVASENVTPTFDSRWNGSIRNHDDSFDWDLELSETRPKFESLIPERLRRSLGLRGEFETTEEPVLVSGEIRTANGTVHLDHAEAVVGRSCGARPWKDSLWFACTIAQNVNSGPPLSIEALSFRERPWGILWNSPVRLFRIRYQGEVFCSESLWDCIRSRINPTLSGCEFEFQKGNLIFRGKVLTRLKDQTGLSHESTDGSLLHKVATSLSDLELQVFRGQKLEATFTSKGQVAYERATRDKNPYVLFLS